MSISDKEHWNSLTSHLDSGAIIRINTAYHLRVPQTWGFKPKRNDDHHIIMVKGGKGSYEIYPENGKKQVIPLERGRLIYISPGLQHRAKGDPDNSPFITPVRFSVEQREAVPQKEQTTHPFLMSSRDITMQIFEPLFLDFFTCWSRARHNNTSEAGRLLKSILFLASKEFTKTEKKDGRFEKLREYIYDNLDRPIPLTELTEKFGYSLRQINRIFLKEAGTSPGNFITHERCHLAAMLLEDQGKTVKEVAHELGYPDAYTFSKQFKMVKGVSPSKARKDF